MIRIVRFTIVRMSVKSSSYPFLSVVLLLLFTNIVCQFLICNLSLYISLYLPYCSHFYQEEEPDVADGVEYKGRSFYCNPQKLPAICLIVIAITFAVFGCAENIAKLVDGEKQ